MMTSLPPGYRALVVGASGAIGGAFVQALQRDPQCAHVETVTRTSPIAWDLQDARSIEALAQQLEGLFHLVVDATGAITLDGRGPEKRLADLDRDGLMAALAVNSICLLYTSRAAAT